MYVGDKSSNIRIVNSTFINLEYIFPLCFSLKNAFIRPLFSIMNNFQDTQLDSFAQY
jgi:hypothetical protein